MNEKTESWIVVEQVEAKHSEELMPYHPPALQRYGGLAELVQVNPGVGTDGGVFDCSLT